MEAALFEGMIMKLCVRGWVDLLLTDVVMPGGIGGFELARRAREIEPRLPIIYMSGYAGLQDEDMIMPEGLAA